MPTKQEDQDLSHAGDIAVAIQGLSTAPLPSPRPPKTTTPIPNNHKISTTNPPQLSTTGALFPIRSPQRFHSSRLQAFERLVAPDVVNSLEPQRSPIFARVSSPPPPPPPPSHPPRSQITFLQTLSRPAQLVEAIDSQPFPSLPTAAAQILTRPIDIQNPQRIIPQQFTELPTVQTQLVSTPSRGITPHEFRRPPPTHLISRPIHTPGRGIHPQEFTRLPTTPTLITQTQNVASSSPRGLQPQEYSRLMPNPPPRPQTVELIAGPAPGPEYDYYDAGVLSQLPPNSKVLVLPSGAVQCLDRGNFPHPGSCKKFISCYEGGVGEGVIGWEYTCPRGLSFDPIGGICNWSAGLGCKQIN